MPIPVRRAEPKGDHAQSHDAETDEDEPMRFIAEAASDPSGKGKRSEHDDHRHHTEGGRLVVISRGEPCVVRPGQPGHEKAARKPDDAGPEFAGFDVVRQSMGGGGHRHDGGKIEHQFE
ncbi:hypothetical protein D9M72_562780 [compost metagenome]